MKPHEILLYDALSDLVSYVEDGSPDDSREFCLTEARAALRSMQIVRSPGERKMPSERMELEWLGRQTKPVWGGHLERGEPITDANMQRWLDQGIIKAVETPSKGYVLTDIGRTYLRTIP